MTAQTLKKAFVNAFVLFTAFAVLVNVTAAAVAMKREAWFSGGSYLLIAVALFGVLALIHHTRSQPAYRWRDASSSDKRSPEPSDDHEDDVGERRWSDYPR